MDPQLLKLWAARTRDLLAQAQHTVGHNQSLDVIAALPGLRSWPEVMAFPERVQATPLDLTATGRLAFRLTRKFGLQITAGELLTLFRPGDATPTAEALQLWPAGPAAGVYVTTEQRAIDALIEKYEEATDGALVYAEEAGGNRGGIIDLGEHGLWSRGLERAPTGTLIVVGPVSLNQSSWDHVAQRLEMACLRAQVHNHRVAVLVETPAPDRLCEDLHLMVRSVQDADDAYEAFVGVVTPDGELVTRTPFAKPTVRPLSTPSYRHPPSLAALPDAALATLRPLLSRETSGLVILGSGDSGEHAAMPLVEALLALTPHRGPVARIMPRRRSTPSKYWNVSEHIKELPFLPSVQSAYDQGFRRMVIYPSYTNEELLLGYDDVLFFSCAWGMQCEEVFLSASRMAVRAERQLLAKIPAILAATRIEPSKPEIVVTDLYVRPAHLPSNDARLADIDAFIKANRSLKYEEQLDTLLASGTLTIAQLKEAFPHERVLRAFLDSHPQAQP